MEFTVNPTRLDPYKAFKFQVKWDNLIVPGVDRVSGLIRRTAAVPHRDGRSPSEEKISPGLTTYAPIVLSRGRTHDTAFEDWANLTWKFEAPFGGALDDEVALAHFRKNVFIELLNEAGQLVMSWRVHRCWPSEYQALSALDANADGVARESLTIENEGWMRDPDVTEPVEPRS
jgi:phage tail-like protein